MDYAFMYRTDVLIWTVFLQDPKLNGVQLIKAFMNYTG